MNFQTYKIFETVKVMLKVPNTQKITSAIKCGFLEASLLGQIKMTENRLEFDKNKLTMMNVNFGT